MTADETREYCYVLRLVRPEAANNLTPEEAETVRRHFAYLESLLAKGVLILAGRTDGAEFGIAIFRAASDPEAQSIMDRDPAITGGVMTATLYPFRVALP